MTPTGSAATGHSGQADADFSRRPGQSTASGVPPWLAAWLGRNDRRRGPDDAHAATITGAAPVWRAPHESLERVSAALLGMVFRGVDEGAYDGAVQRLFSMFPTGRAGIALLLLRMALGVLLLDGVLGPLAKLDSAWLLLAPWGVAFGLWLGLLVPIVAALAVLIELSTWLSGAGSLQVVHVAPSSTPWR